MKKKILALAVGLLVSSSVIQADSKNTSSRMQQRSGNMPKNTAWMYNPMPVGGQMLGGSVAVHHTKQQLIQHIKMFDDQWVLKNTKMFLGEVLPYITVMNGKIFFQMNTGTPVVYTLSKCSRGHVTFDRDTFQFGCSNPVYRAMFSKDQQQIEEEEFNRDGASR